VEVPIVTGPFRLSALAVLAAASALLAGCATLTDNVATFHDTQRRYTQLMRFSDYDHAGLYVAPDAREKFLDRTEKLGDLRFSDYEIREIDGNGTTAHAKVEYFGYRASSPIVVTYVEDQRWERQGTSWIVHPSLEVKSR
jgi:hypothetical protein